MILRDYQQQGIDDIRQAFLTGYRRPLYVLPTGGGKTVMFTFMARSAAERGKRVCILVHRRELLLQTCAALQARHGRIAPGCLRTRDDIQVATVQTLVNRLDEYDFDFVIIDEAHHAKARSWMKVIEAYPDATVLGVTATPCRLDGQGLGDVFQVLVEGPTVTELTDDGYLAPAVVYAPSTIDTSGIHSARGDFVRKELAAAADKPTITGDAIAHYRKYADKLPAIAFCVSVEHAEHTAAQFRSEGYRSVSVDGKTKQHIRDGAIRDLAENRLDVLTSCEIISEGVDVPLVSCGIMLRPTHSMGLAMQQMGRILRPAHGKEHAIILDHAGNCLRHGLPSTPREWSLNSKKRKSNGNGNGPPIRQCSKCYHVHAPAPNCPRCGYEYEVQSREIDHVEGELAKVDVDPAVMARRKEQGRARTYEELVEYGKKQGYRDGWARILWNIRKGKGRRAV